MICRLLLCTALAFSLLHAADAADSAALDSQPASTWRGPESLGQITESQISEASGLAHSYRDPDLLWTNNDSGNEPVLYAVDSRGNYRGGVRIEGVVNRDWEDVASYEIDGRAYLVAADVGDNSAEYPECILYIIPEPDLAELSPARELLAKPERVIRYVYPDGARDCESLAVDVTERAIYVISKRAKPPVAYRLSLFPEDSSALLQAEVVGPVNGIAEPSGLISMMGVPWGKWRSQVTSLDISRDGRRAAVLSYGEVYIYEHREGEDWGATFARGGQQLAAHNLPQAEGICFSPDGQALYVTTEGLPAPLLRYQLSQERDQAASAAAAVTAALP